MVWDEWRYQRTHRILDILRQRWEDEFRSVTGNTYPERDAGFDQVEPFIGPFFESVRVRIINSDSGEVLDYERDPRLKAIAIGGDRLSRGLTLEGLLVSYFVRRSPMYDTLMQMGRWFGFRGGFEDITRIYTTDELAGWFSDLALVESIAGGHQNIRDLGLTPYEVGSRILLHPSMQVTSPETEIFPTITITQVFGRKSTNLQISAGFTSRQEEQSAGIREFLPGLAVRPGY